MTCATPPGDFDSAADGDLDIAYALLLADRQWGSCGTVNYLLEAQRVLVDVTPPLALPVTEQLANDAGTCWSARYASDVRRNRPGSFDAKSD